MGEPSARYMPVVARRRYETASHAAASDRDLVHTNQFLSTDIQKCRWKRVGGIKFKANRGAEGGLGHGLSKDIYLAFHDGKCYDVEIRMAGLASTAFDSETYKKMEFKDYGRVERQFRCVLNSFRFLK